MKKNNLPLLMYIKDFEKGKGISVDYNILKGFKTHSHDHYELEYIVSGKALQNLNGIEYVVKEGDLTFLSPSDIHAYEKIDDMSEIITIHFCAENVNSNIDLFNINADIVHCTDETKDLIRIIKKEYDINDTFSYSAVTHLIGYILLQFKRKQGIYRNEKIPKDFLAVIGYVSQHFKEKITLEFLCEEYHYSKSYFCRMFKKYTGMTFVEYINNLRLTYAKRMIEKSKVSINELCFECGFGSVRHFAREFKKKYGCAPGECR